MNNQNSGKALREIIGGQNVAFEVNNEADFMLTGYKVLKSQNDECFVRCSRYLFNGKTRMMYFTSEFRPLSTFVNSVDPTMFLRVIADLLDNIIRMKQNGFLVITNLDFDADKIFVDTMTMSVRLIYFPISFIHLLCDFRFILQLLKLLRKFRLWQVQRYYGY